MLRHCGHLLLCRFLFYFMYLLAKGGTPAASTDADTPAAQQQQDQPGGSDHANAPNQAPPTIVMQSALWPAGSALCFKGGQVTQGTLLAFTKELNCPDTW